MRELHGGEGKVPSIRDNVRRFLTRHAFTGSSTHFSSVADIYALYLSDNNVPHSRTEEERFRSALGRVLRPPKNSGAWAMTFAVPELQRRRGFISIVSPSVRSVDPHVEYMEGKARLGHERRNEAKTSEAIKLLREARHEKADRLRRCPAEEGPPQKISFRYVDEFMALTCASDLCSIKVYPNGKELAESMAAFSAVRSYLHIHREGDGDPDGILSFRESNVLLLVVGDGSTPRTAATFAFRSAWRCVSVDPALKMDATRPWRDVTSLQTIRARVQDVQIDVGENEKVVLVLWHAHVSVKDALACLRFTDGRDVEGEAVRKHVAIVACYCCNFEERQRTILGGVKPDVEFDDDAVPGHMRTVRVWKFKGQKGKECE